MAEVAAGALVAEQVIATTVEGGALAGYAVSKPTMPLKASFVRFGTAPRDDAACVIPSPLPSFATVYSKLLPSPLPSSTKTCASAINAVLL